MTAGSYTEGIMAATKPDFLDSLFEQIESQVQFGDSKASLLVAGDAILLAVCGSLIKMVSGCPGEEFTVSCLVPSVSLGLATCAAAFLTVSLMLALRAARPAKIHNQPPSELFLVSYIAGLDCDEFTRKYGDASSDYLIEEALKTIHGKAVYATQKFRLLRTAVNSTLLSLGFMVAALILAVGSRVFQ
jgi:pycsar effector protein